MERVYGASAAALHLAPGLTAANTALGEVIFNFAIAFISTGIFALYERRRIDSYGLPVGRVVGARTWEGVAAGIVMAGAVALGMLWAASTIIALIFAADHYFYKTGENLWNVITLVSLSLLLSYSVLKTGTLWFAVGFHIAFDYMQLFVIGTPNGAQVPVGRLLDVTFSGPTWLTGGVLGTEASLLMYPMIALLWIYAWWRFRGRVFTPS
jgi:hypothetical protein